VRLLVLAACSILALVFCVFGYVFLIASGVVGLAHPAGISWVWTALAAAGAHFVIALVLLLVARSQMTKPFFRATLAELKEDREWLKNLNPTNQSTESKSGRMRPINELLAIDSCSRQSNTYITGKGEPIERRGERVLR